MLALRRPGQMYLLVLLGKLRILRGAAALAGIRSRFPAGIRPPGREEIRPAVRFSRSAMVDPGQRRYAAPGPPIVHPVRSLSEMEETKTCR